MSSKSRLTRPEAGRHRISTSWYVSVTRFPSRVTVRVRVTVRLSPRCPLYLVTVSASYVQYGAYRPCSRPSRRASFLSASGANHSFSIHERKSPVARSRSIPNGRSACGLIWRCDFAVVTMLEPQ